MHPALASLDETTLARFCRTHGIRRLSLFGSQLNGTGLLGGSKVDLRTAADLSRWFRDEVSSSAELDSNRMLLLTVVRAIEVIGEAAPNVFITTREAHPELPWAAITGMRHRLVHAYFDVDPDIVWMAATVEVPCLLRQLESITGA